MACSIFKGARVNKWQKGIGTAVQMCVLEIENIENKDSGLG